MSPYARHGKTAYNYTKSGLDLAQGRLLADIERATAFARSAGITIAEAITGKRGPAPNVGWQRPAGTRSYRIAA